MCGPPDQKSERAPLAGRPDRKSKLPCTENSTEAASELQAQTLRRRFAFGYYLAATFAPLIWGLLR